MVVYLRAYPNLLTESIEQTEVHITLSYIYNLSVLIFEREENRSTRRKTLEAQERSTTTTQLT